MGEASGSGEREVWVCMRVERLTCSANDIASSSLTEYCTYSIGKVSFGEILHDLLQGFGHVAFKVGERLQGSELPLELGKFFELAWSHPKGKQSGHTQTSMRHTLTHECL